MKKRMIAVLLMLVMLFALAACNEAPDQNETTTAPTETDPPKPTAPAIATPDENGKGTCYSSTRLVG